MSHVRIVCADCQEFDRPLKRDFTCEDCRIDWIAKHAAEHPGHVIEIRGFFNPEPFLVPRGTQRLTQRRVSGW